MKTLYKILFAVSVVLVIAAAISTITYGLNLGVDFKGGSVLEVEFTRGRPAIGDVTQALANVPIPAVHDAVATSVGDNGLIIKAAALDETEHRQLVVSLSQAFPHADMREKKFDSVGPVIGNELKHKSVTAIVVVLIAISVYIALVFRKMAGTLSWWVMGAAAILALCHDVIIPIGLFAWLGHVHGIEISAVFVAAVLTILGYSISDTVVVFDRVRENMIRSGGREPFAQTVHRSIVQTLVRSVNTNITTLLSLVAIYFFGGQSVRYFALALIVGIVLGAFSSISVASPLLVWWSRKR